MSRPQSSTTLPVRAAGRPGWLTTERAESSYGQPVLVIGSHAYGPGDLVGDARARTLTVTPLALTDREHPLLVAWRTLCEHLP